MSGKLESLRSDDWLEIARKDWNRIAIMLKANDTEAASFFLQQSVEKYIKAYLLKQGWELRKIHELDALLDDVVRYAQELEAFREICERVSGYYMVDRYPLFRTRELTCEEIEKDMAEARKLIQIMFTDESLGG